MKVKTSFKKMSEVLSLKDSNVLKESWNGRSQRFKVREKKIEKGFTNLSECTKLYFIRKSLQEAKAMTGRVRYGR